MDIVEEHQLLAVAMGVVVDMGPAVDLGTAVAMGPAVDLTIAVAMGTAVDLGTAVAMGTTVDHAIGVEQPAFDSCQAMYGLLHKPQPFLFRIVDSTCDGHSISFSLLLFSVVSTLLNLCFQGADVIT